MKKAKKTVLLLLCAVLLVSVSVAGTLAYLTSKTAEVKNTFTVGKVAITLDEAKVDADGKATADPRVTANEYNLMPGKTYDKDPTVHVETGSVASWLFVEVKNDIETLEAATTIADQITGKGWTELTTATPLTSSATVYYKEAPANSTGVDVDYTVFDTFTIDATASDFSGIESKAVTITGYAIQKDSLATAQAAWNAITAEYTP